MNVEARIETCVRCGLPLDDNDDWLWTGDVIRDGTRRHRSCPVHREREARAWDAAHALRACGDQLGYLADGVLRVAEMTAPIRFLDDVITDVRDALASGPGPADAPRLRAARDALALLRVVLPTE